MSAVFSGYSPGILQKHACSFSSILSWIKFFTRSRSYRKWRQSSCTEFLGGRLTVRKWRPTVKNRRSLDRKRFSPENCLKCTKGDFKWKKFENFARSTSMLAYFAQNAPSVPYTIIIIHGVPTSFPVTSAGHGYWGLCGRSILPRWIWNLELNFIRFHSYIAEDSKVVSLSHIQLGPNVVGNRGLTPSEQTTCQHCCYMYLAFPRSYMCCNSRIGQSCERVSKEKV